MGIQNGDKQLGKLEGALQRNGTVLGASPHGPARGFTCKSLVKKDTGASLIDIGKTPRSCALLNSTNEIQ